MPLRILANSTTFIAEELHLPLKRNSYATEEYHHEVYSSQTSGQISLIFGGSGHHNPQAFARVQ